MRIAHTNPGIRGLASYALNLCNYFKTVKDVESLVFSETKWTKQPVPIFEPKSSLIGGVLPWCWDIKGVEARMKEFDPDVIHHHTPCGRFDFNADRFQKDLNKPLVVTYHNSLGSTTDIIDWVMHMFYKVGGRRHFKQATAHVSISKFVRKQIEVIAGVPKDRIVLLYAGVDPDTYKPVPYEKHDTLELLFVGQIMPEKGVDALVDVVKELSETRKVRLTLIGNGHLEKPLRKKTEGHPAFNWLGFVNKPAIVAEWYAKSDAVILPTRWDEAFSYIPIEAMASGTAVVVSETGGNVEAITDGQTGYWFKLKDYKHLYEILRDMQIEKLWEMGLKGREYMMKHHTLKLFGEKYHSLYQNLVNDPGNIKQID